MSNTSLVDKYYDFIANDERKSFEGICVGVYSRLSSALPDLNKACTQTLTSFVATDIAAISGIIRWAGQASFDTNVFNMSFTMKEVIGKAHMVFSQFCDKLLSRGVISIDSDRDLAFKAFLGYAVLENGQNLFIDMNYDTIPNELKELKNPLYKSTVVYSDDKLYSINRLLRRVNLLSFQDVDHVKMCNAVQQVKVTDNDVQRLRLYTVMRFDHDSFARALNDIHRYFEGAAERKLKDVKKDIGKMIFKEHLDEVALYAYAFDTTMMGLSLSIISRQEVRPEICKERNIVRLLHHELNGWAGICRSDRFHVVLSRLRDIELLNNNEIRAFKKQREMVGIIPIVVSTDRFDDFSSIRFEFNQKDLLCRISFNPSPNVDPELLFDKCEEELTNLLGTPNNSADTLYRHESIWRNLNLALLDRDKKGSLYLELFLD